MSVANLVVSNSVIRGHGGDQLFMCYENNQKIAKINVLILKRVKGQCEVCISVKTIQRVGANVVLLSSLLFYSKM